MKPKRCICGRLLFYTYICASCQYFLWHLKRSLD